MSYLFSIHYNTKFGEQLQLQSIEKGKLGKLYPMKYDNGTWKLELKSTPKFNSYYYVLFDENSNTTTKEWGERTLIVAEKKKSLHIHDSWNKANYPENYLNKPFFTTPKKKYPKPSIKQKDTHLITLNVSIPKDSSLVITGDALGLGNWKLEKVIECKEVEYGKWAASVDLSKTHHTIQFKFGIKNEKGEIRLEEGGNRLMASNSNAEELVIYNESYYKYNNSQMPKLAGVAVPVFSIRTEEGMGIGEFSDMKKMGDWMHEVNLRLLQILPINDTIAQHNWNDCYPYAAISVYALNPFYISISNLNLKLTAQEKKDILKDAKTLNALEEVDLDQVMERKWHWLNTFFTKHKTSILEDKDFKNFIKENQEWLYSYVVFCVLRDENKTADFNKWKSLSKYNQKKVDEYFKKSHKQYDRAMFYAWVQYELDRQLHEAIDYLHTLDIKVKGDLPIGIFRHSVEAWKEPELFGMDFQAGAPPDDFAILGQNWEFPTYYWEKMQQDGLLWWKSRFQALNKYFDAMRIDHILGFFRIWRMPIDATQGIMGYFYPAIPITHEELSARGIHFSEERFCKPFITQSILENQFGQNWRELSSFFMNENNGLYSFKEEYNTQRKLENYLQSHSDYKGFQAQLLYLLSNVIFLIEVVNGTQVYHPRFDFGSVESFHHLPFDQQQKLYELYNDYYFMRQDGMWQKSAMEKLPTLLESTDMLICGEDLGLVPKSVPMVMNDLAILSLEVQRMTNDDRTYSDPAHAPYLSVVTTGTHDTSTLRQWWEEDRSVVQHYYNHQLHQYGEAPQKLDSHLIDQIVVQHLHSPAMLVVLPIQDWVSILPETTHPNMEQERINIPANFPHYWRYRMHLSMKQLGNQKELNTNIKKRILDSGRA